MDDLLLVEELDRFLAGQPRKRRIIFVQRYWYLLSIREIAELYGSTESQVKSLLYRMRKKLKICLVREGITR